MASGKDHHHPLCGLLTPDRGEGTCLGYDIRRDADRLKRQVGYMTQRFSLYQTFRCGRTWNSSRGFTGLRDARGVARHDRPHRLEGCEELAGELSGGWKQRLALGACTPPNPQLLPWMSRTAGVDPEGAARFLNEIYARSRWSHGAGLHPLHGRG